MAEEDAGGAVIHTGTGGRAERLARSILDQPSLATPEAAAIASRAEADGDASGAAVLFNALAYAAREMLRHEEASTYAARALRAARLAGLPEEEARARVGLAMIALERGDVVAARANLDRARRLGHLDATIALAGAVLAEKAGDLLTAASLLEDLTTRGDLDDVVRLKALNNLASCVMDSDPERALGLLAQAARLVPAGMAMFGPLIQLNRGLAQAISGRVPEALATIDASEHDLWALTGAALSAEWHLEVARVFGQLRLLGEARVAAGRALAALAAEGGALMRPDALVSAARLAVADGDTDDARSMLSDALALYAAQQRPAGVAITSLELLGLAGAPGRGQPDPRPAGPGHAGPGAAGSSPRDGRDPPPDPHEIARHASALSALGLARDAARGWLHAADVALNVGDSAAAQSFWARVDDLSPGDPVLVLDARARSAAAGGDRAEAEARIADALALIDARAELAAAPDLRQRIATERIGFEHLARELARGDEPASRLDGLLRGRPPAATDAGLDDEADDLRLQWRELARRVESSEESPASLIRLGARLAETERRLRAISWSVGARGRGRPAYGLDRVPEAIRMPLLALARIGSTATGFVHIDGRTSAVGIGPWTDLTADVAALSRALSRLATGGDPGARELATRIARHLDARLSPLASALPPDSEVMVLLDRGLESVPFAALPSLWARPVAVASLALTGPAPTPAQGTPEVVTAAGPRLAHADAEADAVARVWGGAATVRTTATLRAALATAGVVHVAAHATLRWDNPLQSVVHLDDGPLALTEVVDRTRRRADAAGGIRLLYLAACSLASAPTDTALVGAIPTLTVSGIDTVIAASVPLPDAHGPWIARTVHEAVCRGLTPAAGLAAARARVDPADPAQGVAWAALACLGAYSAVP